MKAISTKRLRPIREEAYDRLRNSILMGEYKPGDWLREEEVSRGLGISRMPVREAFRKLEKDRFLEHFPNRGAKVTEVFTSDLAEVFDVRIYVECLIARKAAENISPAALRRLGKILEGVMAATEGTTVVRLAREFHEIVHEASGCASLVAVISYIGDLIIRIRHHNHLNPSRQPASLAEHTDIYEALAAKDPDKAEAATRRHLESSKAFSLAQVKG